MLLFSAMSHKDNSFKKTYQKRLHQVSEHGGFAVSCSCLPVPINHCGRINFQFSDGGRTTFVIVDHKIDEDSWRGQIQTHKNSDFQVSKQMVAL